jgi:hypothetical protein
MLSVVSIPHFKVFFSQILTDTIRDWWSFRVLRTPLEFPTLFSYFFPSHFSDLYQFRCLWIKSVERGKKKSWPRSMTFQTKSFCSPFSTWISPMLSQYVPIYSTQHSPCAYGSIWYRTPFSLSLSPCTIRCPLSMHEKIPQEHSIFIRFQSIIQHKVAHFFFIALRAPHFSSLTHSKKGKYSVRC